MSRDYNEIKDKLKVKISEIFRDYNLDELSNIQKRRIIFDYLCDTLEYDYNLLDKINVNNSNSSEKYLRDGHLELMSVINNNIGICNAISQYYILLLKEVGIKSYGIWCDDSTDVNHQLNIVYNEEDNTYSFDDITSVIVNRGSKDDFFGYDIDDASRLGQGNRNLKEFDYPFKVVPMEILEFYIDFPFEERHNDYRNDLSILSANIRRINSEKVK